MPAERVKANREHGVPPPSPATEILESVRTLRNGSDLVVPSPRDKPLFDTTLSTFAQGQCIQAVPHGFRPKVVLNVVSDSHASALPRRHRIAEYEIVRVLGVGGFGITYLAFDHHLDGPVAIKEYFPATLATRIDGRQVALARPQTRAVFTWGLDRFIDEARSIHRFRHPNVVRAHRYIEAHDTAYIVMEYVEGESLEEILNQRGSLPTPEWRRWLNPLLDGLAHVHGHGYLHRDIKPTNIVIRAADGEPVLIDFGAARVAARERTHTRVLTPVYAPIEQHSTQAVQSPATDIYALAAVSYRTLTGAPPPSAPDRMLDDRYEPLTSRVTNTDRTWLSAIDRGLRPRPEHRPQTVAAWRALMEASGDPAGTNAETVATDVPAAPAPSTAADVGRRFAREQIAEDNREETCDGQPAAEARGPADAGTGARDARGGVAARPRDRDNAERAEAGAEAGPEEPRSRRAAPDSAGDTRRPATGNLRLAAEPSPHRAGRDARPPQFEIRSPLTCRTITYGGAHAVPIDWLDGYVDLMEDCYLEPCEEPELSLPEQEESLLMVFYSLYSALKYGDHGFDRILDEVLARLGDEDDHDDAHESWWRDGELREIVGHQVRGLERCGDDRTEVRAYISCVEDWITQYQNLRDEPGEQTDSDLRESEVKALVSELEASAERVAERLSASAVWFDEWEKSEYAVDVFFECMRQLRLLHHNGFEAARVRVERAIPVIAS